MRTEERIKKRETNRMIKEDIKKEKVRYKKQKEGRNKK